MLKQELATLESRRKTPYPAFFDLRHWRGISQLLLFQPFTVKLFGKPKQVLSPVDTKLVIQLVCILCDSFGFYTHFLCNLRAALPPHDAISQLIFAAS